ncbi:MAG: TylF/MycF/NovP-related O-methyltransferase [Nocardioides sp.]
MALSPRVRSAGLSSVLRGRRPEAAPKPSTDISAPDHPPAGAAVRKAPLAKQLRRLRRRHRRLRAELDLLRDFTRDPWPEIEVPDRVEEVIDQVGRERLSYLAPTDLRSLAKLVREADRAGREGVVIEAGTALGGSAIVMAAAKDPARPMRVYDVFGLIPPPSGHDPAEVHQRYASISKGASKGIGDDEYYGYHADLLGEVTASFDRLGVPAEGHRVELVKGLFEDTVVPDGPVALAHIDGDWYESTMTCLERIAPMLAAGGRIVLDDYYFWPGCREAVHDYFTGRAGFVIEHRAKVHVVRR